MKFIFVTLLTFFGYEGEKPYSKVIFTLDYPKNDTFRIRIYPLSGDDLYIERAFDSSNYCIEKIFRNHRLISETKLKFNNNRLLHYEESAYEKGVEIETRQKSDSIYPYELKRFSINDSLSFEIRYYRNGLLASCGLTKDFCYCSNVYNFDTLNRTYWTGSYSSKRVIDTVYGINELGEQTFKITQSCSKDSVGSWIKINAIGRILEEVEPKLKK